MNDHFLAGALLALTVFAGNLCSAKAQGEAAERRGHAKPAAQASAAPPEEMSGVKVVAVLVDAEAKAQRRAAAVQVKVQGLKLVDPALAKERPVAGQGHLHYRVDDGPIVATTATKLSFHELKPGSHTILVQAAGNDHAALGSAAELAVTVP